MQIDSQKKRLMIHCSISTYPVDLRKDREIAPFPLILRSFDLSIIGRSAKEKTGRAAELA
jgi:hypothetical protein